MSNFCYEWPRPGLTSDIVLFAYKENHLKTLLIQRRDDPFKGMWAFPGGFVEESENAYQGALRELEEETHLKDIELKSLFFDSQLNRDPRGWTVSEVYYGFLPYGETFEKAGDDAAKTQWFNLNDLPDFAFDHDFIINKAIEKVKELILFKTFGFEILPLQFDIIHLMQVYLTILKDNNLVKKIIKKLIELDVVLLVDSEKSLFRFNKSKVDIIQDKGFLLA